MQPVGATGARRGPEAEVLRRINDAGALQADGRGITIYAAFMHRKGLLKAKPASFTDAFVS